MAVRDILLDDSGERVIQSNDYGRADGQQAVKQGIACRVRLWRSECWLDEEKGVDYAGKVLIRNPSQLVIQAEIGRAIAETPDVTQVKAVSFTRDTQARTGSVRYTAVSTAGTITGSV